jgi:uncharacterized protein (TIGR03435 family)
MLAGIAFVALFAPFCETALGQTADVPPKFEAADVHSSPHRVFAFMRAGVRGDRYVVHDATMVDLVAAAYGVEGRQVLGGPAWLELDHFDVEAKLPIGTPPEMLQRMLQSMLAERFKLVARKDTQLQPAFLLTVDHGKPKLKPATGTGDSGCHNQPRPQNPQTGEIPSRAVACRNVTMAAFAQSLRELASNYFDEPVVDSTGLNGSWDFDLHWTPPGALQSAGPDGISIFDAVDKQLGLKLEKGTAPMPVVLVDSVSRKPTPNRPDLERSLPPLPSPAFGVAVIKPSPPGAGRGGFGLSGNSFTMQNVSFKVMIDFAWGFNSDNDEAIDGIPKSLDAKRFDVVAKADPASLAGSNLQGNLQLDLDSVLPMLRTLLTDRFQMAAHIEDRPVDAYSLVAAGPKMKRGDPASRSRCATGPAPGENDPRPANPALGVLIHCQNITMTEFAEQLPNLASGYFSTPVKDATGLPGGWDFTLNFSAKRQLPATTGGSNAQPNGAAEASTPNGTLSLFEATEKQIGLRLEKQKRPLPVLVITHVLDTPTEN